MCWEFHGKFQDLQGITEKTTSASDRSSMELEPGQLVFVKEVHGNVWKTGVINQPALEPD